MKNKIADLRFINNSGILSSEDQAKIQAMRILIVGVGGLGGYLAHALCRMGVHDMCLVDKDLFSITNLNRQLFSTPQNIGQPKVDIVKRELLSICPDLSVKTHFSKIEEVDESVFKNIDIVFDAVDNIYCKIFIEKLCGIHNRPLIHGAIGGWYGQVGISLANSNLVKDYYQQATSGLEQEMKAPTFVPPFVAHLMVAQFVMFCLNKEEALINQILNIDMLNNDLRVIYRK